MIHVIESLKAFNDMNHSIPQSLFSGFVHLGRRLQRWMGSYVRKFKVSQSVAFTSPLLFGSGQTQSLLLIRPASYRKFQLRQPTWATPHLNEMVQPLRSATLKILLPLQTSLQVGQEGYSTTQKAQRERCKDCQRNWTHPFKKTG